VDIDREFSSAGLCASERERANRKNRSSLTAVNATGEMRKKQIASNARSGAVVSVSAAFALRAPRAQKKRQSCPA